MRDEQRVSGVGEQRVSGVGEHSGRQERREHSQRGQCLGSDTVHVFVLMTRG